MNDLRGGIFVFGPFRMDAGQRMLWRNGDHLPVTPKEFETLLALVERGGESTRKEDIVGRVWPDTFVGDSSLTRNISVLRRALGDDVIQTLPKFGYRLTLPVIRLQADIAVSPVSMESLAQEPATGAVEPLVQLPASADSPLSSASASGQPENLQRAAPPGIVSTRLRRGAWVLMAVLAAGAYLAHREAVASRVPPQVAMGPLRIAVLPFVNLTGDDHQEYVCDGLTEAMISELSRLSPDQLDVIARTSAMPYKNTTKSVPQIARELKAAYVLESSLRESGRRIRVTSQLVRGADAGHVWTGEYDRDLQDVLALQQDVAIAIGQEIKLKLAGARGARLRNAHAVDAEAYRDYLLGRFYWNRRDRDGLLRSVGYFKQAIARDSGYAPAYAGLADAYLVLGGGYLPDRESYGQAKAAALKALQLDPALAEAYCSLAYEKFVNEWDWSGADENFQRALSLNPSYATAHHWYALYLASMLRTDEATREIDRALELDPLSVSVNYNAGWILTVAGRQDEAIQQLKKALEIDPQSAVSHDALAAAYVRSGRYAEAVSEYETAHRLGGDRSPYDLDVARVYALAGRKSAARGIIRGFLASEGGTTAGGYNLAVTYAALGETEPAFRWLRKSIDDHSCTVAEINTDHGLDPLRSDPRFADVRREFHLPDR